MRRGYVLVQFVVKSTMQNEDKSNNAHWKSAEIGRSVLGLSLILLLNDDPFVEVGIESKCCLLVASRVVLYIWGKSMEERSLSWSSGAALTR